jgi:plastocyanin
MPRRPIAASIIAVLALLVGGDVTRPATAQAGGGCHGPDGSVYTEGPATVVRMDVCSFGPTVARVPVGTTVRFLNTAPNEHMVTGRAGTWGSGQLAPNAEFSARFDAAGIYPYACPLHPGMVGAVIVGDVVPAAEQAAANEPAAAPASVDVAAAAQVDSSMTGEAALAGAVAGAMIGALATSLVRRRRPGSTPTSSSVTTTTALDG